MTDLEIAINELPGHSVCFCKDGALTVRDGRGILPLIELIDSGVDFRGCAAADIIVGRAAALLFVGIGVSDVYGKVMSRGAKGVLERRGIPVSYGELTDVIINRAGTDMCPMEKAVAQTDDPEKALVLVRERLEQMKKQ